jgi:hypothetical protein
LPDWLVVLNWLTAAWLVAWAVRALVDISSDRRRSISFVLLVFALFYGVPIILDLSRGIPEYRTTPGFRAGAMSDSVTFVYDLFVVVCPVFWWLTARSPRRDGRYTTALTGEEAQPVLWLLLCSPLIALAFAPQPSVYLSYGAILSDAMSPEASDFHGIIGSLSMMSLIGAAGVLLVRRNFGRTFWLVVPFMTVAVWLQGKRVVVALCFVLIWAVARMRGFLTGSRVFTFGAIGIIALGGYVTWYQLRFRPLTVADGYSIYESSRIEYGRDHDLKAAIYCELADGGTRLLEYRGQTMLFDLTMFVPRSLWPGKPLTYATYVTAYALRIRPAFFGWGITTSFLDEAVANFGWAGLLIGPFTFALLCRICDDSPDPLVKVVGVLVACLLMTVEFVAFAPLAFSWILYTGWSRRASRCAPVGLSSLRPSPMPGRA